MGLHERFATTLVRHPRTVLALGAAVTAVAILLLFRLKIDTDINSLVRRNDPALALTRRLQADSPQSRTLIVVLRSESPEALDRVLPGVAERLRASPHFARVLATRQEFAGSRIDWFRSSPLYALPSETLGRLQARLAGPERKAELEAGKRRLAEDPLSGKEILLRDPLGTRWIFDEAIDRASDRFPVRLRAGSPYLVTDRPPLALLRLSGRRDSYDIAFSQEVLRDVNARLAEAIGGAPVRVELAGGYVTAMTHATMMRHDLQIQFISSAVAVLLYLWLFTRSLIAPHFVFAPIMLSIVWGLGFGTAWMGPLTPLAMSMVAIVAGLGSDYPIHLLSRFRAERATMGRDPAIVRAQTSLGRAFVGAATTTMGGFLVLVASGFPGLRQFGLLVFLGFTLCVVASVTIFPVLLIGIDRWVKPPPVEPVPWVVRWARAVYRGRARRPVALLILLLGLASWAGVALGQVPLDLDLRNTMAPGDPGQRVLEGLETDLGIAVHPVYALVDRAVPLEDLRLRLSRLRASGTIVHADGPQELAASPASIARVEEFRRETRGWTEGTLADLGALGFKPEPFRRSLAELEALLGAPPPDLAALDRPEFADLRNRMIIEDQGRSFWVASLFVKRSPWLPKDRAAFDQPVRAELGAGTRLLSAYHAPDEQAGAVQKDLGLVGGLAVGAVVLLTIASLGRLGDGLLALVPVLVATGITLASCTLLGGTIQSMNLAAIPIILGIGVDGGIHFVARHRALGWRDPGAVIGDIGAGYWGATWTTILGFGSIAFSATPGLLFLGILVIVGMVACTAATLFMLPVLISWKAVPPRPGP
jgi:predicted RND superfamily exporter protein